MNRLEQKPKLILIVEDDPYIRKTFCLALELDGYEVKGLSNGQEALSYLLNLGSEDYPHSILLDLMMPIMDGNNFLKEIMKLPLLRNIPIVICSANGDYQSTSQVVSILKKPVTLSKLSETFCHLFNFKRFDGMIDSQSTRAT